MMFLYLKMTDEWREYFETWDDDPEIQLAWELLRTALDSIHAKGLVVMHRGRKLYLHTCSVVPGTVSRRINGKVPSYTE